VTAEPLAEVTTPYLETNAVLEGELMSACVPIENALSAVTHAPGGRRVLQVQGASEHLVDLDHARMYMSSGFHPVPAGLKILLQGIAFLKQLYEDQGS
jgi:hypothetical protein